MNKSSATGRTPIHRFAIVYEHIVHLQRDSGHKVPIALATLVFKTLRTAPIFQGVYSIRLLNLITRVLNFQVFGIVVKSLVVLQVARCLEHLAADATN